MNEEKRRLWSSLLSKCFKEGQILSLLPAIDAGVTLVQITEEINKLDRLELQ